MSNKLHFIGTNSPGQNGLYILNNEENSLIMNNLSGKARLVTERTDSIFRPIHCSELQRKLSNRGFHKAEGIYFSPESPGYYLYKDCLSENGKPADEIDVFNPSENNYFSIEEDNLNTDDIKKIEEIYIELFGGDMTEKEINFYNASKNIVDIIDSTVLINLIRPTSDIYTDTVSFESILNCPMYDGVSGKVDVSVYYSKKVDSGISTFVHDTTFCAFNFKNGGFEYENLVEDINSDVRLEYINNKLKVSPLNNFVTECIINKCDLTFGKF